MYKYKKIKLKDGTTRDEHRLIMEKKIGRKLKSNECVHHINGDGKDNREENLEIVLLKKHTSNHKKGINLSCLHKKKIKKSLQGEKAFFSKLTDAKAAEVKSRLRAGETNISISKIYGVHRNTICDIKHGRSWTHVN